MGDVSRSEPDDEDDEAVGDEEEADEADEEVDEVERRASEMFANVVRPQFGSTSRARLLICVVIESRLDAAFWAPLLLFMLRSWASNCVSSSSSSS